jgi:uncharacterized protein YjbJ (UPF0337 family)
MNKDIIEGKWKQVRGEAKAWWGKSDTVPSLRK